MMTMCQFPLSLPMCPDPHIRKSLKKLLVSKVKLDLARVRAKEEAEAARMAYEHKQRMELSVLKRKQH